MASVNVAYINPFIVATRELFDSMVHVPVTLGKPYLREPGTPAKTVSAFVTLSGPVSGVVVLGFSQVIALALASEFSKETLKDLDADCLDALAEIANIVVGNAKKSLPGGLVKISVPAVVRSPAEAEYPAGVPVLIIPCDTSKGRFSIDVALRQTAA